MSCHLTVFSSYKYSYFTRWNKNMGLAVGWFYVLWKWENDTCENLASLGWRAEGKVLDGWAGTFLPCPSKVGVVQGGWHAELSQKGTFWAAFQNCCSLSSHTPGTGVQGAPLSHSRKNSLLFSLGSQGRMQQALENVPDTTLPCASGQRNRTQC